MKLFVWDFHGVLEKGNDRAVLEITNRALTFHGHFRQMTESEGIALAGLRWHEYFAFLLPEHSADEWLKIQSTCFEIGHSQPEIITKHIQLNDHADLVLSSIEATDHQQILISNTVPKSLDMFIEIVGIEKYFPISHRFAADTHHQKAVTKKNCLGEFLKRYDCFESIISIGDSPSDMSLIEQDGVPCGVGYLYSHPGRAHRLAKADYKINDLRHVLQEIRF